jgi:hypothetical protein
MEQALRNQNISLFFNGSDSSICFSTMTSCVNLYTASSCILSRNCHFPPAGRCCMTHRQALQDFSASSQISLPKNNEID